MLPRPPPTSHTRQSEVTASKEKEGAHSKLVVELEHTKTTLKLKEDSLTRSEAAQSDLENKLREADAQCVGTCPREFSLERT